MCNHTYIACFLSPSLLCVRSLSPTHTHAHAYPLARTELSSLECWPRQRYRGLFHICISVYTHTYTYIHDVLTMSFERYLFAISFVLQVYRSEYIVDSFLYVHPHTSWAFSHHHSRVRAHSHTRTHSRELSFAVSRANFSSNVVDCDTCHLSDV